MSGTIQLPKPPIRAGMTTKNTMIRPCAVTITFHHWPSGASGVPMISTPAYISSIRIRKEKKPPISPAVIARTRYSVPMSLWLVE
jgi:hypothetical protein